MGNRSFKEFYKKLDDVQEDVKWNVILFTGDYNPITREEYKRVGDFVKNFVKGNNSIFDENADIGLLTPLSALDNIGTQMKFELTFEERQFLAGKFFGFKMFPVDFNELFALAHFNKDDKLQNKINVVSKFLKDQFQNSNILIVLRPSEGNFEQEIKEISTVFSENDIKIGFVTYEHVSPIKNDYFKNIPIDSIMIKACCLLDAERPSALAIKNFAYKFNLQEVIDQLKTMHFKTNNEKYELVFRHLFPDIKLYERSNEEQDFNTRTVMEIVKKMYTSKI